jgi:hypothetical protein
MNRSEILNIMIEDVLCDVFVIGFVDEESRLAFHPIYDKLFFCFEKNKIEMYLDEEAKVNFRFIENIELWFHMDETEGRPCVMSIHNILFQTDNKIDIIAINCDDSIPDCKIYFVSYGIKKGVTFNPMNRFGFSFELVSYATVQQSE